MKKTIICIVLLAALQSCNAQSIPAQSESNLPEGYFTGAGEKWSFMRVFVQVSNHTAIADFIIDDKGPRDLYTDTLAYDLTNKTWRGKTSRLFQKKGAWYVATTQPAFETEIKLKANEAFYKQENNWYKNAAVIRRHYVSYITQSTNREKSLSNYNALRDKYELLTRVRSLDHIEFLKMFEKFKAELSTTN